VNNPTDYKLLRDVISTKFKEGQIKEDQQAIENDKEGVQMIGTDAE
jgi:hypothetical protein